MSHNIHTDWAGIEPGLEGRQREKSVR